MLKRFLVSEKGVTPVVGIILLVLITVVLGAIIAVSAFNVTEQLKEPHKQMIFGTPEIVLGAEYRDWWPDSGSNATHGDIDIIYLDYIHGPVVSGDEVGSVTIRWSNSSGEVGELSFVNPAYFGAGTQQSYHNEVVGNFSTGSFYSGDRMLIRMTHNEYQYDGKTDRDKVGFRYVESNSNRIDIGNNGRPFFVTENRYPIEFSGDRPIRSGDRVDIIFLNTDHVFIIAEVTGIARQNTGNANKFPYL
ncbi:type IV pilin N-terminal domain-containing protein [Methanosalsum natronophilum]|uniref:type IV pilin N-terminal domain-containing protein n=1 Tax=Methanosalsum natronophilum TaxID=768733 RepID=UPI00216938AD|nr:type IV pilin N-terminal domain-containing protein [Methanosalsum natronophilum]